MFIISTFLSGVSIRRLFCLTAVVIGIFITAEPAIFNIDQGGTDNAPGQELSLAERVLWPFAFAMGFVPVAISYVLTEKEMKRDEVKLKALERCVQLLIANVS